LISCRRSARRGTSWASGRNPLITLNALSYYDDVSKLAVAVRRRLGAAVAAVDPARIPVLIPYAGRPDHDGSTP
jgi:hypothetical protein